jgi:hypothetical protein
MPEMPFKCKRFSLIGLRPLPGKGFSVSHVGNLSQKIKVDIRTGKGEYTHQLSANENLRMTQFYTSKIFIPAVTPYKCLIYSAIFLKGGKTYGTRYCEVV